MRDLSIQWHACYLKVCENYIITQIIRKMQTRITILIHISHYSKQLTSGKPTKNVSEAAGRKGIHKCWDCKLV